MNEPFLKILIRERQRQLAMDVRDDRRHGISHAVDDRNGSGLAATFIAAFRSWGRGVSRMPAVMRGNRV